MPPPRLFVVVAAALLAPLLTPPAARGQGSPNARIVINFGLTGFGSATGNWGANVSKTKQGLFVHGEAAGDGSVGGKGTTIDLGEDTFIEFVLAVGPSNAAAKLKLVLRDADGTEIAWSVLLAGLAPQSATAFRLELDKPEETLAPGTEPGFSKKTITNWRIVGDGTPALIQALMMSVRAGK